MAAVRCRAVQRVTIIANVNGRWSDLQPTDDAGLTRRAFVPCIILTDLFVDQSTFLFKRAPSATG